MTALKEQSLEQSTCQEEERQKYRYRAGAFLIGIAGLFSFFDRWFQVYFIVIWILFDPYLIQAIPT